jgi:hypothetical protein
VLFEPLLEQPASKIIATTAAARSGPVRIPRLRPIEIEG